MTEQVIINRTTLAQLLESCEIRRQQWRHVAEYANVSGAVDELQETGPDEADAIANRLQDVCDEACAAMNGDTLSLYAEASADLWEAALAMREADTEDGPINAAFDHHGTAEVRDAVAMSGCTRVLDFYNYVGRQEYFEQFEMYAYDWEIVPAILQAFFSWATLSWEPDMTRAKFQESLGLYGDHDGWDLFSTNRGIQIQRDDEIPRFENDAEAMLFVQELAAEGEERAAIAMRAVADQDLDQWIEFNREFVDPAGPAPQSIRSK